MATINFTITKLKKLDPNHIPRLDVKENSEATSASFPEVGSRFCFISGDDFIGTSVVQSVEHMPDKSVEFETLNSRYRMVVTSIVGEPRGDLPAYAEGTKES